MRLKNRLRSQTAATKACGEAFIDGMSGNPRPAECSTVLSRSVRSPVASAVSFSTSRLARLPTFPDRLELRIILLHLLMTRHAGLRVRHIRLRRDIDKAVAITAIHSQLGNVNVVGKRDRLDRLVTDLGIFRGDVIPGAGGKAANNPHAADGQLERQPI